MTRIVLAVLAALGAWMVAMPDPASPGPAGPGSLVAPAWADQKDKRLPGLFKKLKAAPTAGDAALIESDIWKIWFESGDPALDTLMDTGSVAMQGGDYQGALAAFDAIIKKKPDFAEGWNRRATLYYLMGDYDKSVADIAKTLKLEPRHIGAISGLGLIRMQQERFEDAEKAYLHVLAISPKNAGARHNLETVRDLIKKRSI
jgi:tetratricopeptide (TPR) repeat protein